VSGNNGQVDDVTLPPGTSYSRKLLRQIWTE
jgi:hypothetical protein